jgi:hypothetical protein
MLDPGLDDRVGHPPFTSHRGTVVDRPKNQAGSLGP